MENPKQQEQRLSMIIDGNKLEIITWETSKDEWSLCVENCHDYRSVWFECFNSPHTALAEGRRAIMEEGVEAFITMEEFDFFN